MEDGFAWFMYGDSLRVLGRTSEAIVAIKKTLGLAPAGGLPDMHILLGKAYHDSGKFNEAEKCYAKAAEKDTDSSRGWLWIFRGINLAKLEKFEEATKCYSRALELEYNQDEAYLNLGYVSRAMGKYEEAADAFKKSLSITPDYPEAQEALESLEGFRETLAFIGQCEGT